MTVYKKEFNKLGGYLVDMSMSRVILLLSCFFFFFNILLFFHPYIPLIGNLFYEQCLFVYDMKADWGEKCCFLEVIQT